MRKKRAEKRFLKPDPKYNEILVSKFVNSLMYDGKKSTVRKMIYSAFDHYRGEDKETGCRSFQKSY